MLVIRFQRTGRSKVPTYRLVVAEKARPVKSKFLEILGHFIPAGDPAQLEVKRERIAHWISRGAVPSDTAARQLKRAGLDGMEKFIIRYAKRKSKNAEESAAAPVAAAVAPAAESSPPPAPAAA